MSLRKKMEFDSTDLSIKHTLKNWVGRSKPPADGKSRLLKAATQHNRAASHQKVSKLSGLISMTLNEHFNQIYLESFKKNPYYSLQPGSMIMNFTTGMTTK
jgi:hypothetical protein